MLAPTCRALSNSLVADYQAFVQELCQDNTDVLYKRVGLVEQLLMLMLMLLMLLTISVQVLLSAQLSSAQLCTALPCSALPFPLHARVGINTTT